MDLSLMRRSYAEQSLEPTGMAADPHVQFDRWMRAAIDCELIEPNAMALATVGPDLQPSIRTVLLKGFDERGLVFYTNHGSTKARQIAANSRVALLFQWLPLERQVSITGHAVKLTTAESLAYFVSRPRDSQIGAWASRQSEVIGSRSLLEAKFAEMKARFSQGQVPLPSFWGGYRVVPESFEFWQGRKSRLHDRLVYRRESGGVWALLRLMP